MRRDASQLLSRIGSGSFKYQGFGSAWSDGEPWPIFESILQDVRVVGDEALQAGHRKTPIDGDRRFDAPALVLPEPMPRFDVPLRPVPQPKAQPIRDSIFSAYAPAIQGADRGFGEVSDQGENVRAILLRLSQARQ